MTLQPGASHDSGVQLGRDESAQIVVRQQGVDVVVEMRAPDGKLIDAVDGPTGRDLVRDFDGVAFVPRVTADEMPSDRPHVAPRRP